MGYEKFDQTSKADSNTNHNLNLCDIFEVGNTLKNDITTYGPGMLDTVAKAPLETKIAAGAAGLLVTAGVLADSPVIFGVASAAGLMCAGKALADTILPKCTLQDNTNKH